MGKISINAKGQGQIQNLAEDPAKQACFHD